MSVDQRKYSLLCRKKIVGMLTCKESLFSPLPQRSLSLGLDQRIDLGSEMCCDGLAVPGVLLRRRDGVVVCKLGDAVDSGDGGRELAEPEIVGRLKNRFKRENAREVEDNLWIDDTTRDSTRGDVSAWTALLTSMKSQRGEGPLLTDGAWQTGGVAKSVRWSDIYEIYGGCSQTCFG